MKKIHRAEISTIKDILYPVRKHKDTTWDKKNLKDLKELHDKKLKEKEEKEKQLENQPDPFKLKKFQNIPSKFISDTEVWIKKKQRQNSSTYKRNLIKNELYNNSSSNIKDNKNINKSPSIDVISSLPSIKSSNNINRYYEYPSSIIKEYTSNNVGEKYKSQNINLNKNQSDSLISDNNYCKNDINTIEKESNKDIEKNYLKQDSSSLIEQSKSNSEEIEKLIQNYREKYGETKVLETLVKEYNEIKKQKENQEKEELELSNKSFNIKSNGVNEDENNNYSNVFRSYSKESNKPPLPNIDDTPLILPKINKNYIRENKQLVIENKIPQKKRVDSGSSNPKHRNYGKVPEYIKKYEREREVQKEELQRKKEALKYPKGTKLLTEEERINTLNALFKAQKEMTLVLEKMPITTRTLATQNKKEELIRKLDEVEKAIDMFSKKRVFVKAD